MEILEWKKGWQLWDLINYLSEKRVLNSMNLYRGQSNEEWGLVPGLYRSEVNIFSPSLTKEELYIVAEERMIEAFFHRAALLLPNFKRSPIEDRLIAQHYGVPTQLLDWTLDPFIALFFAVSGENKEKDCALFYIAPLSGGRLWKSEIKFPWKLSVTKIVPPVIDERIRTQKAAFTLQSFGESNSFTPLDQRTLKVSKVNEGTHSNDEVQSIGKVVIPAERRNQILFQLMEMGIDSSLVYPGLQGIGQRIAEIGRMQKYGGSQDY